MELEYTIALEAITKKCESANLSEGIKIKKMGVEMMLSIIVAALVLPIVIALLLLMIMVKVVELIFKFILRKWYFEGDEFQSHKEEVADLVNEYNELAEYIQDVNNSSEIEFLESSKNSHLAKTINTSRHNYRRDRNVDSNKKNVRPSTLNIVKSAYREPIKYFEKYFILGDEEDNLVKLEDKLENLIRLENAIENLDNRKSRIENEFSAPRVIERFMKDELMEQIGLDVPEIKIEHQEYIFEYVSAGGNSSQNTVVALNEEVLEKTILYLSEKIDRKKSASYQRSLMTPKLRQKIKERDNYTCQSCEVSVYDQDLLLLEIDHIIPVSKGGLSTEDNLQTLCWKCNRSKSDKIL